MSPDGGFGFESIASGVRVGGAVGMDSSGVGCVVSGIAMLLNYGHRAGLGAQCDAWGRGAGNWKVIMYGCRCRSCGAISNWHRWRRRRCRIMPWVVRGFKFER